MPRDGYEQAGMQSQEFISYIHRLWIAASDLSRRIHVSVMNPRHHGGGDDEQTLNDWISVLLELWIQIRPFVNANMDEGFKERFNKWEPYFYDPWMFEEDPSLDDEIEFYKTIGEALQQLKITSIEAPF